MTQHTVYTRATSAAIRDAVSSLPMEIRSDATREILDRVSEVVLGHIRTAFIAKSRGGTDEAGDRWAPLAPSTIRFKSRRRPSPSSRRPSSSFKRMKGMANYSHDKYARNVAILIDSGQLLDSLSPGSRSPYKVVRVSGGSVVIGTNRPWAVAHHRGIPGRLPQRRLWPTPHKWPAGWWQDALREVQAGLVAIISRSIKNGT